MQLNNRYKDSVSKIYAGSNITPARLLTLHSILSAILNTYTESNIELSSGFKIVTVNNERKLLFSEDNINDTSLQARIYRSNVAIKVAGIIQLHYFEFFEI